MKENETKALELNEEELAQVSGGRRGGTADDGKCGMAVLLNDNGRCTSMRADPCNGCQYF